MAGGLAGWLGYEETELEPVLQAEILLETGRTEARIAILEILVAFGFGAVYGMGSAIFRAVSLFALITIVPLLIDSAVRRRAAARLRGVGPQPRLR